MPILNIEQSVHDDVAEYKQYPMLNQNNIVRGFIYDIKTGLLKEIK
jgi:carbonic anhydrase